MRKLAHIERIDDIFPIKDADKIEVAKVLGWDCVVKKGEFKKGDIIIYVEVDSIVPDKPQFEFLRDRKFRVKTIKLRGQVSQGLVLPLGNLSGFIGDDVTDVLGITKYLSPSEQEEVLQQKAVNHWTKQYKATKWLWRYVWFRNYIKPPRKKEWPSWVAHTDEERIQNMPSILERYKDKIVYITEKIDYQSVTFTSKFVNNKIALIGRFLPKKFDFIVCSRNMRTHDKNSLYWKIAKKYDIEKILKENPNLTIQGEQGDLKVQGNKYGLKEPRLWVFNIIDYKNNYHYNWKEMYDFCTKYNLDIVPVLDSHWDGLGWSGKLSELGSTVQELVEFSKGKSLYADIPREGIVVRCIENGEKIFSFKVINPDFLLKY